MSSEARTIRPFVGLESFESALSEATLHFGEDVCEAGATIYPETDSHTFGIRPVELAWARNEEQFASFRAQLTAGAAAHDFDPADLSIVVIAQTSYLKEAALVLSRPLSELNALPRVSSLTSEARPRPFSAWRHGFTVDAHVLLGKTVNRHPLRPWRHGTWFARARFSVSTAEVSRRLFHPVPLDDEERARLRLPKGTMRFVEIGDHDILAPYGEQGDEPKFYMDASLLAELNAARRASPVGDAIQLDLALRFITAAVHEAARRSDLERCVLEDIHGSLIGRIVRLCAGPDADAQASVLREIRNAPERVVALAEDQLKIGSALLRSLRGNEA